MMRAGNIQLKPFNFIDCSQKNSNNNAANDKIEIENNFIDKK